MEANSQDWPQRCERTRAGDNTLTLRDVSKMGAGRELDGWYVAAERGSWTIGRRSRDRYYPLVVSGQPVKFESVVKAERYLRALLLPIHVCSSAERQNFSVEVVQLTGMRAACEG